MEDEGLKTIGKGEGRMEDSAIVDLYLRRDEDAVGQTAKKYGARLRHLAAGILGDPAAAEECENDTYLRAWERIPPQEPRDCLFPFLGRITRHLAIDELRRSQSRKRSGNCLALTKELAECLPGGDRPEERLEAEALRQSINAFLAGCSREQRELFVRRYWFFDSIQEISRRCGLSQSKVKTTLFRLREKLRERLETEGYIL